MEKRQLTIRCIDPALYKQARLAALVEGVRIGDWINEAIKARLGNKTY